MSSRQFFWMYSQIDRVEALESQRQLMILAAVNSEQKTFEKFSESLVAQIGEVESFEVVAPAFGDQDDGQLDPEFDREGLMRLKALGLG